MTNFYSLTPKEQEQRYARLARLALERWDIRDAEISVIKMRENCVFRVVKPGGERVVLRIHRHAYHSDAALRSELQWMTALERAGIAVPGVVPSSAGNLFEVVHCEAVPEARQVDLFQWIDGEVLGSSGHGIAGAEESLRSTFGTMGELAARVHNQSSSWRAPEGFVRHAWDADGLTGEQPFWGRFWELDLLTPVQRQLLLRTRALVDARLRALPRTNDVYGIIHADLTPENVMVHEGRVRLLDFDDAGYGWYLFEIATALFFHLPESYFEQARDSLIEGYRRARPLPDEQLALLPLLFMARGFTYLGWIHTRSGTQTAIELGPMLVEMVCGMADQYK